MKMHTHVRNCLLYPHPAGDLDEIGPALRELDDAVTSLERISETQPQRLIGDAAIIAGGIQGLRLVLNRIEALRGREAAE